MGGSSSHPLLHRLAPHPDLAKGFGDWRLAVHPARRTTTRRDTANGPGVPQLASHPDLVRGTGARGPLLCASLLLIPRTPQSYFVSPRGQHARLSDPAKGPF